MALDLNDPMVTALQEHKKVLGLPWDKVALLVPMSPQVLMRLARGLYTPTVPLMQKLARYMGWGPAEVGQIMLYKRGNVRRGKKK